MLPHVVIGIDADINGAVAVLDCYNMTAEVAHLPTHKVTVQSKDTARLRLDERRLACMFRDIATVYPASIYIEQQMAFGKDGGAAMLTHGTTFGLLKGCAVSAVVHAALDTIIHHPDPVKWKGYFGLLRGELSRPEKKKVMVKAASSLFPNHAHLWPKVKDASMAEAMLIALYGALTTGVFIPNGVNPTHKFTLPKTLLLKSLVS